MAGPYCATLLADLGAMVIKVEKPRRGDLIRFTDTYVRGQSGYFLGINRGKKGLTVDLRTREGQRIIQQLAGRVDVLIENFRPGMMDTWSLGYSHLSDTNAGLIYCSMSAFGDASDADATGNDITLQAYSGLMDLTGYSDGPPAKVGAPVIDAATSLLGAVGILTALYRRTQTGRGEHLSLSLLEAAYALMPNFLTSELNGDVHFQRLGSGHPQLVPYQAFLAADGKYVVVGAFHRASWQKLCRALGREDLLEDDRFRENWDRLANREALIPLLQAEIQKRPSEEWLSIFREADIPASPVLALHESLALFRHRIDDLCTVVRHQALGELTTLRPPVRFSQDPPPAVTQAAPALGQDTDAILASLGYTEAEIEDLRRRGIV